MNICVDRGRSRIGRAISSKRSSVACDAVDVDEGWVPDFDFDGVRQGLVVPDHRLGIQLRHPGRADHHGRRADLTSVPAVTDARARPLGGGSGHNTDPPVDVFNDNLEHASPLAVVKAGNLTSDAQCGHAVDTRTYEQIDDATETRLVDVPIRLKWSREDRINAFELQEGSC